MSKLTHRVAVAATLMALAGTAAAHTGHGTQGLLKGLEHPFGMDHLLAMVAVGAWSAATLQGVQRLLGPITFVVAMSIGAVGGAAGPDVSVVDAGIAASLVSMGVMLFALRRIKPAVGLMLIGAAGTLHGLAHGAELPAHASFASYALGFVITTAALHAAGLALGAHLLRARPAVWRAAGLLLGGAGLVFLTQV